MADEVDVVYPAHGPTPLRPDDVLAIRDAYEEVWSGRPASNEDELFALPVKVYDFGQFSFLLAPDAPLATRRARRTCPLTLYVHPLVRILSAGTRRSTPRGAAVLCIRGTRTRGGSRESHEDGTLARGTAAAAASRAHCEDERRRLARDLHDGPAQTLAAALFGVDLAVAALDRSPATARDELLAARTLVRDALDDVRALMTGLRPRLLEDHGLVAALHSLAASPPLWGPRVVVETSGPTSRRRLPAEVELALFRIAQEAVSNARRHGAASQVRCRSTLPRRRSRWWLSTTAAGLYPTA